MNVGMAARGVTRRRSRVLGALLAGFVVGGLLPLAAQPPVSQAVGPEEPWMTLVRTIGFRSAAQGHLGNYAAIGDFNTAADGTTNSDAWTGAAPVTVRPDVNQLSTEFGLFPAGGRRFKLLGANGRWLAFGADGGAQAVKGSWAQAWSFQVIRPRAGDLGPAVLTELQRSGIPVRLPVCVRVFNPSGRYRGWLQVGDVVAGGMPGEYRAGVTGSVGIQCGTDTSTLFLTDALPRGTPVGTIIAPPADFVVDAISRVRFVAPDVENSLSAAEIELANLQVDEFFDDLWLLNDQVHANVDRRLGEISDLASVTSFFVPGEEPQDLTMMIVGLVVDVAAVAVPFVKALQASEDIIQHAMAIGLDVVELGAAGAANASLTGPRSVESVGNDIIYETVQMSRDYKTFFDGAGTNVENLEASIRLGCLTAAGCTSDRRLAMWRDLGLAGSTTNLQITLQANQRTKAYEYEMYRRFIGTRGVLRQVALQLDSCTRGTGDANSNVEFLEFYEQQVALTAPYGKNSRLLVSNKWKPYQNVCHDDAYQVDRAVFQAWSLGWKNDDEAITPAGSLVMGDLFSPYDMDDPAGSGLGLSRAEVACEWVTQPVSATSGYAHDPCDFAFYDLPTGYLANPADMLGMPYTETWYVPDADEVANGRSWADPDVVSRYISRLEYGSCSVNPLPRSTEVGRSAQVFFVNLANGPIQVFRVTAAGAEELTAEIAVPALFPATGQLDPDETRIEGARVGDVYVARSAETGACLGTWTVLPRPVGAVVPYRVAEVHGPDGLLGALW